MKMMIGTGLLVIEAVILTLLIQDNNQRKQDKLNKEKDKLNKEKEKLQKKMYKYKYKKGL